MPIIVDTKLQATDCQWNHDGSVLAICGMRAFGSEKDTNVVMFYSPFGVVSIIPQFSNFMSRLKYLIKEKC